MVFKILAFISGLIIAIISKLGYLGVVFLMAIESACIPLPSEVIMPFSGFLVFQGRLGLWETALAGALGCLLGSLLAYWVGLYGGRPLIERYGKYLLISHADLDRADRFFQRYGEVTVFFSRFLPVIRTYISFPAGIAKMDLGRFSLYTFLGSLPWSWGLAYLGLRLGGRWTTVKELFRKFDLFIGAIIVLAIFFYLRRHFRLMKR